MTRLFGSVRARAALAATLVVAVALLAAGTAVLLSLRGGLESRADAEADAVARQVASRIAARIPYADLDLPDGDDHPVQVVDEDGRVLAVSEGLEAVSGTGTSGVTPLHSPAPEPEHDDQAAEAAESGELAEIDWHGQGTATVDGERQEYRFAGAEVTDLRDETVRVYAGASLAAQQDAVRTASGVMLAGFPLLLAVVASVTWLVTRRALRPVEDIRREMAEITASADLTRRVPEPATHDEIARLARTTNETLAALETSVERQRRFVADASHELRSPIASLRTQLEVAAAHPALLDLDGAVEDTVRLQRLAADLLLLARLDAGERPADARVDLSALAREEAAGRPMVTVEAGPAGPAGAEVAGSRGQLGRVLANLLDNAERHARSAVTVTVRRDGDRAAVVRVADDGEGVPEADRERIFERFVRLDDARSRDEGGAGLGLAIARDVAVRHGGTLTAGEAPGGGALFELRLPLA
ncbi:HAMP domain-containing sensor histidine kinase [Streptomyces sp. JB150]|uniref:sensor histidine kinase n=1 Tax=Streptomyces sp. JB150 TaxID=2714844 RepID=UPI0014096134|nr:HAMP domain-containing sensor histidine kinase [Streptomyces sp. JB150]QIJ64778.1 HAMP domain-containing histidine kinase [Streptomyces sp. JB150]